jgi:hypothetical protein
MSARLARVRQHEAAGILGVSTRTLQRLIATGHFTAQYPHGKGLGRPCFLRADEIEAAVIDWNTAKRRAEAWQWKHIHARRRA